MAAVRPQRTSAIEKMASSAAITMSQAAMTPVPPPKHPPCTSATVGTGNRLSRSTAAAVALLARSFSSSEPAASPLTQLRSAPAWKCRPLPRKQQGAQPLGAGQFGHRRQQLLDQLAVVGIADLRAVEHDAGDATRVNAPKHGFAAHSRAPLKIRGSSEDPVWPRRLVSAKCPILGHPLRRARISLQPVFVWPHICGA